MLKYQRKSCGTQGDTAVAFFNFSNTSDPNTEKGEDAYQSATLTSKEILRFLMGYEDGGCFNQPQVKRARRLSCPMLQDRSAEEQIAGVETYEYLTTSIASIQDDHLPTLGPQCISVPPTDVSTVRFIDSPFPTFAFDDDADSSDSLPRSLSFDQESTDSDLKGATVSP